MNFLGANVTVRKELDKNLIVLKTSKEQLTIDLSEDPPYYIRSEVRNGHIAVMEHGELPSHGR